MKSKGGGQPVSSKEGEEQKKLPPAANKKLGPAPNKAVSWPPGTKRS